MIQANPSSSVCAHAQVYVLCCMSWPKNYVRIDHQRQVVYLLHKRVDFEMDVVKILGSFW